MIDLGTSLTTAYNNRQFWGRTASLSLAEHLAGEGRLAIDWDDGAGEDWLTLIQAGEPQALLGAELPLLFTLDSESTELPPRVTSIMLPSMTRPILCCDRAVLEQVFHRKFGALEFYPAGFSALDLAMTTI
ncbi:hypothetical protein EII34_12645 [Arachnia propionica]|uniref:Uncharacterized protein n=2 Tax=Arachnia propionica TaxID=1750 RepID=A0A3P1T2Z5_9ACTN|nr:hypothetical protein [Arachnia propionica]MDO5082954.1 hypothetical protein [Arachnia propionica]RRD03841.1 hypothetical protein EII34_12645 [Arachnia propionica]